MSLEGGGGINFQIVKLHYMIIVRLTQNDTVTIITRLILWFVNVILHHIYVFKQLRGT